jgi:hypothetical protein
MRPAGWRAMPSRAETSMDPQIVDEQTQTFDGRRFRRRSTGHGYYARSCWRDGRYVGEYLHREVWAAAHGEIPPGMHVHHIDGNVANNALSNLMMLPATKHLAEHMTAERIAQSTRIILEKGVPAARAWHATDEGRRWHSENAKAVWRKREAVSVACETCGRQYQTTFPARARFCHQNCRATARRRAAGVSPHVGRPAQKVTRTCASCGSEFDALPGGKRVTCSVKCWTMTRDAS